MYATSSSPARRGADRTGSFCRSNAPICASVPCATGALSADVSRAAGSQCSRFHSWAGDHQTVRRPRSVCRFARPGTSVTQRVMARIASLVSDWHTSPSESTWLLFLKHPHFLSPFALFTLHSFVFASSLEANTSICSVFALWSMVSSSTISLRISWATRATICLSAAWMACVMGEGSSKARRKQASGNLATICLPRSHRICQVPRKEIE
jgi:hypothetical protein